MAQTNYTPISLYYSATTTNVPTAGNLVAGELALNTADGKLFYKDSSGVVQTLATKDASAGTFTSITDSGNLTFTGTGNRIRGDFSSATSSVANRVIFQTSTANSATRITAIPNGTNQRAFLDLIGSSSDPANASALLLSIHPAGSIATIESSVYGTGTYLPLTMYTGGSERLRIDTSGNVLVGTTSNTSTVGTAIRGAFDASSTVFIGKNNSPANANWMEFAGGGTTRAVLAWDTTGGGGYIGSTAAYPFSIYTNNAEVMRIDSSGNLGIGTAGGTYGFDLSRSTTNGSTIRIYNSTASSSFLLQNDTAGNAYVQQQFNGPLVFATNNAEKMRIDSSGSLLIGRTSNARSARLEVTGGGSYANGISVSTSVSTAANYEGIYTSASGTAYFGLWTYNGTSVGSISSTGTVTVYSTTSDYRLKTNVSPMTGALATVQALKPVTYKWKTTGEASQGFIAHELQAVVPECVVGEKDAVNEDGSIKPQGIDTSFLVATLTAAIQEQQALIESLTTRLTALENK